MKKKGYLIGMHGNRLQTVPDKKGNQSFPACKDGLQTLFFNDGQVDRGIISDADSALKA
jgi:hypothetical protein